MSEFMSLEKRQGVTGLKKEGRRVFGGREMTGMGVREGMEEKI